MARAEGKSVDWYVAECKPTSEDIAICKRDYDDLVRHRMTYKDHKDERKHNVLYYVFENHLKDESKDLYTKFKNFDAKSSHREIFLRSLSLVLQCYINNAEDRFKATARECWSDLSKSNITVTTDDIKLVIKVFFQSLDRVHGESFLKSIRIAWCKLASKIYDAMIDSKKPEAKS